MMPCFVFFGAAEQPAQASSAIGKTSWLHTTCLSSVHNRGARQKDGRRNGAVEERDELAPSQARPRVRTILYRITSPLEGADGDLRPIPLRHMAKVQIGSWRDELGAIISRPQRFQ
jgi:hypothetical protein